MLVLTASTVLDVFSACYKCFIVHAAMVLLLRHDGCGHVSAVMHCCATHAMCRLLALLAEMPSIVNLGRLSAAVLCCSVVLHCCSSPLLQFSVLVAPVLQHLALPFVTSRDSRCTAYQ